MFFLKGGCREGQSGEMKEEKRKMKRTLWSWGQAMERFGWKAEELEKMEGFYKLQRKIWEGNSNPQAQRALEKAEREYEEKVMKLRLEMEGLLMEKARVDGLLRELSEEEQTYVRMRFEKGYGFEYICMKMHLSRATLFRMQDRLLEKLILAEEKVETP